MADDVPLLIPEINADHLSQIARQRRERGWSGAIVTNPNCSTVVLAMVLAPLRQFGLRTAVVTTLQAVSGAGYPGVPSLDILGNVIPNIDKEEAKIESETRKILGTCEEGLVSDHPVVVAAHTTRVPVVDGHTLTASIALDARPSLADVRHALDVVHAVARRRSASNRARRADCLPRRGGSSASRGSTACAERG